MTNISASFIAVGATDIFATGKPANQAAGSSPFDKVLAGAESRIDAKELAGNFIDHILRAMDETLNNLAKPGASTAGAFPFSGAFEATFGSSGPLIDFINVTTSKLGLSAAQNQALQDIAVRNKDITRTPASIAKIGEELRQAGIG